MGWADSAGIGLQRLVDLIVLARQAHSAFEVSVDAFSGARLPAPLAITEAALLGYRVPMELSPCRSPCSPSPHESRFPYPAV